MDARQRNENLSKLYCAHWDVLKKIIEEDPTLSMPFLTWAHSDYENARVRLVVVGKETNGWADDERQEILRCPTIEAVTKLMAHYRDFELGKDYRGKSSFWVPVRELYENLNPEGAEMGFVSLNVTKVEQNGGMPSAAVRDRQIATRLLAEEIRILDPHVVVFHTGPSYENWLHRWFPGLKVQGNNWFAELKADALPRHSYRTYHPRYLNYRSRRREVYAQIVKAVH
jgi:hypothetical protein